MSLHALEEVDRIYHGLAKEFKVGADASVNLSDSEYDTNIRRSLAEGLLYQMAYDAADNPKGRVLNTYRTVHDNQPALLQSASVLVNNKDDHFIVFSKYVHTGKQHLQDVTAIDPAWIIVRLAFLHSFPECHY